MNRYTLLFMAGAALLGHYAGTPPAVGLLFAWAWAMMWNDAEHSWGNKSIGQIMAERRERKR